MATFGAGTKRHNFRQGFSAHSSGNTEFSRISNLFLKAQKGTAAATSAQPAREVKVRNSRTTSL